MATHKIYKVQLLPAPEPKVKPVSKSAAVMLALNEYQNTLMRPQSLTLNKLGEARSDLILAIRELVAPELRPEFDKVFKDSI